MLFTEKIRKVKCSFTQKLKEMVSLGPEIKLKKQIENFLEKSQLRILFQNFWDIVKAVLRGEFMALFISAKGKN